MSHEHSYYLVHACMMNDVPPETNTWQRGRGRASHRTKTGDLVSESAGPPEILRAAKPKKDIAFQMVGGPAVGHRHRALPAGSTTRSCFCWSAHGCPACCVRLEKAFGFWFSVFLTQKTRISLVLVGFARGYIPMNENDVYSKRKVKAPYSYPWSTKQRQYTKQMNHWRMIQQIRF